MEPANIVEKCSIIFTGRVDGTTCAVTSGQYTMVTKSVNNWDLGMLWKWETTS